MAEALELIFAILGFFAGCWYSKRTSDKELNALNDSFNDLQDDYEAEEQYATWLLEMLKNQITFRRNLDQAMLDGADASTLDTLSAQIHAFEHSMMEHIANAYCTELEPLASSNHKVTF